MSRPSSDRSERVVHTNFAALFERIKDVDLDSLIAKADPKYSLMDGLIQIEEVGENTLKLL